MWVLAARFDLHVPASASLKDRRRVVRPVVEGLRSRFNVAVAEVAGQDTWQRVSVGVAVVGSDSRVLAVAMRKIERFVVAHPELDLLDVTERLYQTDDE